MKHYVRYRKGDGFIVGVCTGADMMPETDEEGSLPSSGPLSIKTDSLYYVGGDPKRLISRPESPVAVSALEVEADPEQGVVFSNLPVNARVRVLGGEVVDPEGESELELCFDVPDTYTVIVSAFPYRDFEREIVAV